MASTCRICQRTEMKGLIPLSHRVSSQRKSVSDMLIAIGGSRTTKMEEWGEYDRLPQHVCDGCFERLEQTYSLRTMCRRSLRKLLLYSVGGTTDTCCLICCTSHDKKELFVVDVIHERWEMKLSDMIEQLIDVELIKDRSQKYTCMSCSIKLYSAYKFKRKCLKSEANWLENVLYPWEKMEVDGSNPEHLVVDLYAEVVEDGDGKAHCSICLLSVDLEQVDNKCEGCMLEFWNDDETEAQEVPSPAEEESSACGPLELNCDEEENQSIISQELDAIAEEEVDDERLEPESPKNQSINSQELDAPAEEEQDDERLEPESPKPKVSKPKKGYVEDPEKVFDIIEEYPDDPFPTVRRKGPCCCKCFKFFATKSDMANHQTESHPASSCSGTLPCDFCESYKDKSALEQHKKSMDTFVYDFCRSCQIVFESPKLFRTHRLKSHMDPETIKDAESNFDTENIFSYDCCVPRCFNRYSSEEQLLKHCAVAHGQKEEPVQENKCQYCEVVFNSNSKFLNHRRIEKVLYKCQIDGCNYMRIKRHVMWLHCSQKPHSKYVRKKDYERKILVPDMKHFTVIGELDSNTDILQRQCQLCCRCFLLFDTKEELAAHCELHRVEADQPFQCEICSRGFKSRHSYTVHSQLQKKPTHYHCRTCKIFLWRKIDYLNHKVADHLYDEDLSDQIETVEDHSITCCGCWETFETEEELVGHRRRFHPPPPSKRRSKRPACDYCHKLKDTMKMVEQHIAFYESKISYRCKVTECVFQTKSMNHIRRHILLGIHQNESGRTIAIKRKKHPKKEPNDYHCCVYFCVFHCTDYDAMIEHAKADHADKRYQWSSAHSGRPFTCQVCCKGFTRLRSLLAHKLGEHHNRCRRCQKHFRRNVYFTHTRECTELLKCTHCGEMMSSERTLREHLHNIHSVKNESAEGTKHTCSICGKLRRNITEHMKGHDKKRIYKCATCGTGFHSTTLLTHHQRTHRNEREFPCREGCDKRYKAPGDRVRHEKLVHLGIKPFACNLCPESFVRDRDLRLHLRKHTGLKLYPCSYCSASFDKLVEYEDHCVTCVESIE